MFLTQKQLSRRTVLKGMGLTLALPMLEAMVPVKSAFAAAGTKKVRLVAVEMVHGAAGSAPLGLQKHLSAPIGTGRCLEPGGTSLRSRQAVTDGIAILVNAAAR